VITLWMGGCVYAPDAQVSPECDARSAQARHYIERSDHDAVVLNSTVLTPERTEIVTPCLEDTHADHTCASLEVIAQRDLPRMLLHQAACVRDRGPVAPA